MFFINDEKCHVYNLQNPAALQCFTKTLSLSITVQLRYSFLHHAITGKEPPARQGDWPSPPAAAQLSGYNLLPTYGSFLLSFPRFSKEIPKVRDGLAPQVPASLWLQSYACSPESKICCT